MLILLHGIACNFEISVTTMAMLDSGAAENFIDKFARVHDTTKPL